jgi:hypothetical protein
MAKHEHRRPSHPAAVRVDTVTQRERARLRAFDDGSTGSESLRSGFPQVPWTGAAGLPPVASSRRCAADLGFSLQLPLPGRLVPCKWSSRAPLGGARRAVMGRGERTRAVIRASGPGAPSNPPCPGPTQAR